MLCQANTFFVLVDLQGKLAYQVEDSLSLIRHVQTLIYSFKKLNIPIILLEQYPQGLGETVPEVAHYLKEYTPISKITFDACQEPAFMEALAFIQRKQAVVAGIEAHVCVYQTVTSLLAHGYSVDLVSDAISSRTSANRQIGMQRMREAGAKLSSTEMVLFELMKRADSPVHKEIIQVLKNLA